MKMLTEYINILKDFKRQHSSEYGIEEIGIFGSVARGEQRENSDVDVCVRMSRPNLFILSGIKQDLEVLFGCSVDVVRKHDHMSPAFLRNIERDCVYV